MKDTVQFLITNKMKGIVQFLNTNNMKETVQFLNTNNMKLNMTCSFIDKECNWQNSTLLKGNLQINNLKELSNRHKLTFSYQYIFATLDISNLDYYILRNSKFEISNVYDFWSQRFEDYKIWVCGENSIPLDHNVNDRG